MSKHLTQSSPSKGLRVYNAWARSFNRPTLSMGDYLARADVQAAYPAQAQVDQAARIAALEAELAALKGERKSATTALLERNEAARTPAKPASEKSYLWRPWAINKHNLPTKVGATFRYRSKKSGKVNVHRVVKVTSEGVTSVRA